MSKNSHEEYLELLQKVLDETARLLIHNFPAVKSIFVDAVETVFAPRTVLRQFAIAVALETGTLTIRQVLKLVRAMLSNFSSRSRLIRQLQEKQKNANSQDEWMDLAERIDNIQGNDVWRSDPNCPLYERERISARIDEFVHLMRRRDIFELMFVLRGGIGRNKFGLLHEGLFSKALAGSKVLAETYHNVVCAALDFVCDSPLGPGEEHIPTEARLAFFNETRHSYGRTALLLSGGAALGYYHVGVVKTLMENNLMPRVIGGSSAGSLVCAMIGTRTDIECTRDLFQVQGTEAPGHSGYLQLNFFRPLVSYDEDHRSTSNRAKSSHLGSDLAAVYRNTAGAFHDAKRTWQVFIPIGLRRFTSTLYDILTGNRRPQDLLMNDTEHFRACCRANIGSFTFQEAFDRTGRILNITVTPQNKSDPPRLLNYLTSPHVLVWSAAVASSSLPGVFEANRLMVKDADGTERYESAEGASFSDGSMEQDLPMQQLSEMFNVNHFIVSQANPHAVMFASYTQDKSIWSNPISGFVNGIMMFLKDQIRAFFTHLVEFVGQRRIAPLFDTQRGIGTQFFTQEYEGRPCDISLIPWINHRGVFSALLHCIYNPSDEEFLEWIRAAERETWKCIPAIKSHIAEEVTLDRCVQRLRKRLINESRGKTQQGLAKMGDRVPSFFNSPSLVNLGGLAVADNSSIDGLAQRHEGDLANGSAPAGASRIPSGDFNLGWGGHGLRGNRSSASLNKDSSVNSGLFIDAEHRASSGQLAGEQSATANTVENTGYVKTTRMADFYYRKVLSNQELTDMRRSRSHQDVKERTPPTDGSSGSGANHLRRMSKSHSFNGGGNGTP